MEVLAVKNSTDKAIAAYGTGGVSGGGSVVNSIFEHIQNTPASSWNINHLLGFRPNVSVKTLGGVEVEAEVQHVSTNQVIIRFDNPATGIANFS